MIRDPSTKAGNGTEVYAKDMTIRQRMAMEFAAAFGSREFQDGSKYALWIIAIASNACDLTDALIEELNKREERRDLKACLDAMTEEAAA